jgi:hypothetical protein
MKKLVFSICAGLMLTIVACKSGPSSSDPKATLIGFFKAMSNKDLKGARKFATKESESMLSMMEMAMKTAENMKSKEMDDEMKFEEANMTFGETRIDGDKAFVPVTDKKKNETSEFILKKEDGAWKVAFDKASMAEMAGKKMQERDGEEISVDSLNQALENINADSLSQKMQESMKTLDSLTKGMKKE